MIALLTLKSFFWIFSNYSRVMWSFSSFLFSKGPKRFFTTFVYFFLCSRADIGFDWAEDDIIDFEGGRLVFVSDYFYDFFFFSLMLRLERFFFSSLVLFVPEPAFLSFLVFFFLLVSPYFFRFKLSFKSSSIFFLSWSTTICEGDLLRLKIADLLLLPRPSPVFDVDLGLFWVVLRWF